MSRGTIHLFEINSKKMALDVESDSLHVLDHLAWDAVHLQNRGYSREEVLSSLSGTYPPADIEEVLGEIEELASQGQLWSAPPLMEGSNQEPVVKALCLNVAHTCNLTCRYCFAGKGEYGGNKALMPTEVGRAAIDFLLDKCSHRRHAEVDYFGGEPLLNLEAVREITDYARRRGKERDVQFRFTLTTNGLLLDDKLREYLDREGFSVVLSLDGRPEVHDLMRSFPNGTPSYQPVQERLQRFVQNWPGSYFVRGTYTRFNRDFFNDVVHLYRQGYRHISLEPAVADPAEEWSLRESDLEELSEQYRKLADFYLECYRSGDPFTFFHFEIDLDQGPCLYKRLSGCGAGEEYLAVTPEGDVYPCHQLVGRESYLMGNVRQAGDMKQPLPEEIFPPAGPLLGECAGCWARYHCGGGCRAASLVVAGEPTGAYPLECALQRCRLEYALYLRACIKEEYDCGPVYP